MRKIAALFISIVSTWLFAGCYVGHPLPSHHHQARIVIIPKGHAHTNHCGHYKYKNKWYFLDGHSHGPGCGHVHTRGVWVIR